MTTLGRKLTLGFKPVSTGVEALLSTVENAGRAVRFQHQDELTGVIGKLPPFLKPLIYAQLVDRAELLIGDSRVLIGLDYYPDVTDEDELEVAHLELLDIEAATFEVRLFVRDAEQAAALGAEKVKYLSSESVKLTLRGMAQPEDESTDVPSGPPVAEDQEKAKGGDDGDES